MVVRWSGIEGHLESQLEVRDAPIALPQRLQLPSLTKSLVWNDPSKQTKHLCVNLHSCFICLCNQCSLNIIVPCSPGVMAEGGAHDHISMGINQGRISLAIVVPCWPTKMTAAGWRWQKEMSSHCLTEKP